MIPKFRAFLTETKTIHDVLQIDFSRKMAYLKFEDVSEWYWFKELVLMQSTGLKDKNGVEIFEGDVVKITVSNGFDYLENELAIVKESDYHSGLICKLVSADVEFRIFDEEATGYQYEVVGGIYENPELLEAKA